MKPSLFSYEIEAHIPGKTFERPNLYKRPSPLIASLSLKNGTSKMKINDLSSMKSRIKIKSKSSSHTIGKFLRKLWAILFYKIRQSLRKLQIISYYYLNQEIAASILCYFIFSLMNALVYVDISQGIH